MFMRRASIDEVIDLRHRVLRPGRPLEAAQYPEDRFDSTRHFALFDEHGAPLSCLTLIESTWQGERAWQLRGMATDERVRATGVGSLLLPWVQEQFVSEFGPLPLWCNARAKAVGFYAKHGWKVVSDEFEVPDVGPHFKMLWRPPSA